jgi:UDP-glucose 4-epimerase
MISLKNKKVLVTGGAGFIGSHLTDRLIREGCRVVVIDNLSTGTRENLNPKVKLYKADISGFKINEIFKKEKPEIVFHLAAQINIRNSVKNPVLDAKINILATLNLLEICKDLKIKKFIFASTGGAIYGEDNIIPTPENCLELPNSPYGIAKLTVEKYLNYYYKFFGLSFISLRLANVYGPRQNSKCEAGVIAIFCDKIFSDKQSIINGSGFQTRDFVFIDDVIEAFFLSIVKNKVGIFNIGTAKETDIRTIFRKLKKLTNSKYKEKYGPAKKGEQEKSCLNYFLAKKELAWQPKYSLEEGLEKTIKWFKIKHYK